MRKSANSENDMTEKGVPRALLWCQVFRPCFRRGLLLLALSVACLFVAVTLSKSLLAWTPLLVPDSVIIPGASVKARRVHQNLNASSGVIALHQVHHNDSRNTSNAMVGAAQERGLRSAEAPRVARVVMAQRNGEVEYPEITAQTLQEFGHPVDNKGGSDSARSPSAMSSGTSPVTSSGTSSAMSPRRRSGSLEDLADDIQEIIPDDVTQSQTQTAAAVDSVGAPQPRQAVDGAGDVSSTSEGSQNPTPDITTELTATSETSPPESSDSTISAGDSSTSEGPGEITGDEKPTPDVTTEPAATSETSPPESSEDVTSAVAWSMSVTPGEVTGDETPKISETMAESVTDEMTSDVAGLSTLSSAGDISAEMTTGMSTEMSDVTGHETVTEQMTTAVTHSVKPRSRQPLTSSVACNTSFCEMEAKHLSSVFKSGRDPCDNFYMFACTDWNAMSSDSQEFKNADDALAGSMEDMAKAALSEDSTAELMPLFNLWTACMQPGAVKDDELGNTLSLLGIDLKTKDVVTADGVLKAAGKLLFMLNNAPLLTVGLSMNPMNSTLKVIAIEDGDSIVSRSYAMEADNIKTLAGLACKFTEAVGLPHEHNDPMCRKLAQIAFDLAKASTEDMPISDRMMKYTLAPYNNISMFKPFLDMMDGSKDYMGEGKMAIVKNYNLLEVIKAHLKSSPSDVFAYLAFHTAIYLSPFLEGKDYLWDAAMFVLTGHVRPHPVPKWRLCLRLIDRVLPSFMIAAFDKAADSTPLFTELMADIMAEEIRSAFIDEVMAIERVDNWTRHVLTQKAQSVVVLSFFPARYTANVLVNMMSTKINKAVEWKNKSMDYFLQVSALVAPSWTAPMHHPLVDRRRGMSIFDTDCHFNPEKNVVVLPLAFYNLSVPTSQKERMFHIPRIGPRLTDCLFRATFATNFFMPNDYYWTNYASSNFDETAKCFGGHYRKNQNASMFTRVEENSGIAVAFEAFEDRLFSKQYLQMDYILEGLPDVTADQLFFIYYALSHCEISAQSSTTSMMNAEERVNVPLMNSFEFSAAFKCANDSKMNPSNKCSFWD